MLAELQQIVTKDGVPLEGLLFEPKRKSWTVAVWLGGLTSRFSNNPKRTHALAKSLAQKGVAFAIFDHRGFGVVNTVKVQKGEKKKYILVGTGFEKFEHSVLDIDAILRFLKKHGYKNIFILGHSTGANKAAYYIGKRGNRGLAGIGLLGPLSDIPGLKVQLGRKYNIALKTAGKMVRRGRGKELVPFSLVNGAFWSAERFWSIAREGSNEDTFPYYNPKRKFRWTKKIRLPVIVLIGEKDQYADGQVPKILEAFRQQISNKWFSSIILKNSDHGFTGKEKELARKVADWIARVR